MPRYALTTSPTMARLTGKFSRVFTARDREEAKRKAQRLSDKTGKKFSVYGPLQNPGRKRAKVKRPNPKTFIPAKIIIQGGKARVFVTAAAMRKMNPQPRKWKMFTKKDVDKYKEGFGYVLPIDVGKKYYVEDGNYFVENDAQRDARIKRMTGR